MGTGVGVVMADALLPLPAPEVCGPIVHSLQCGGSCWRQTVAWHQRVVVVPTFNIFLVLFADERAV